MRTNHALTRIIIYSLLTVLLLSILLVGLGLGSLTFHINVHNGNYETGGATVSAQSIQRLKIEWVTGTVYLKTAETDHIQFSESGATDEKTSLAYRIENNTLTILFQKNNVIQFGFSSDKSKDLTIIIPNDHVFKKLEIETAACELNIANLHADTVEIDGAGENIGFSNCQIQNLDIDTAACNLQYTGKLETLDCDSAATKINAKLQNKPKSIDIDGASVDFSLTLPTDCGFRLEMDGISNHFDSQFPTEKRNGVHVSGDGTCSIEIDGLSNNVSILKQP